MPCTARGALPAKPSPAQPCQEQGADTWLCANTVSLAGMGHEPSSSSCSLLQGSSWDSCQQQCQSRALAAPEGLQSCNGPSVQDPVPQRATSRAACRDIVFIHYKRTPFTPSSFLPAICCQSFSWFIHSCRCRSFVQNIPSSMYIYMLNNYYNLSFFYCCCHLNASQYI